MSMSQKTILVVEDSIDLAESLQDMLELKNYRALIAMTGRKGVSLALNEHPDLIILDIRLPDIDGYEVYRLIREDDWGATAKIMILTASESIKNISKNVNLPIEHVLFKPDSSITRILSEIEERLNA
jgi:DNA-binding response OmpR family regulator